MSTEKESINLQGGNADELMALGAKASEAGDVEKAIKYYEMAGKAGNTDGYAEIGLMYQYGEGVELSHDTALYWHQKVIDAGDMDGYWLKGNTYREMEAYAAAAECYEIAFEKSDNCKMHAAYDLAMAYHYGEGKEENFAKALELYHLAAENGLDYAMLALGKLFQDGDIVQEDHESALYWYEKARDAGNEEADRYIKIDELLDKAEGALDSDDGKVALESLQEAADLGDVNSMVMVGSMYSSGAFCEINHNIAFKYFLKAAEAGHESGMLGVALAYSSGNGVNNDKNKALEWYEKAVDGGSIEATAILAASYIGADKSVIEYLSQYSRNELTNGSFIS